MSVTAFLAALLPYNILVNRGKFVLFLKSLDITGFKSFARSTRFEFTPGITALVGPNGSGKSNVVDAIRWCLGEQSVRDLRGQRAEDVIYAGSRHSLGASEVALTFSPSREETSSRGDVTIARRLYRSGESEYSIDGRKRRLRDLMDELRNLGVAGSRHIVVTQGMADALLSAAPMERRGLLEQAAGLSGYRVRRDEARQKLSATEHNIATISLVLEEIEPRLRTVRRQARAVTDRAEAHTLLQQRLHDWYASRWENARSQADGRGNEAERNATVRRDAETRLAQLEDSTEAALELERADRRRLDVLVSAHHALERDRDSAERARSELEYTVESILEQLKGVDARIARARAAEQQAADRVAVATDSLQAAEADLARLRPQEEVLRVGFEAASRILREAEAERKLARHEAVEQGNAGRAARERVEDLVGRMERAARRRQEAERSLSSAATRMEEGQGETGDLESKFRECKVQYDALMLSLEGTEHVASRWRMRATRLEVLLARTRGAASDAQRRRDAAKKSLEALGEAETGSLLSHIDMPLRWEVAVAAALGTWAHAPIGRSEDASADDDRDFQFRAWRATLEAAAGPVLWADGVVNSVQAGRTNPLRTAILVEAETDAERIWNSVRSLPAHTVQTPPVMVASMSGVCWHALGREVARGDDRTASYLRLKRNAATMASRFAVLSARAARLDSARNDAFVQRTLKESEVAKLQGDERGCRTRMADLESMLASLEREREDLLNRTEALGAELRQLALDESSMASEYHTCEATQRALERNVNELTRRAAAEEVRLEAERIRVATLEEQRREARHAYEAALAARRAQTHLQATIQSELHRLRDEIEAGAAEKSELERTRIRLEADLATQKERVAHLQVHLENHSATLSATRAARPESGSSVERLRAMRGEVSIMVRNHERAQAESIGAQARLDELLAQMTEELHVRPEELTPSTEAPPSEAEVRRLRTRAMQYADAEPSVIDEARDLAERHVYLSGHLADLRAAAETLQAMMDLADTEMRSQFDVAFRSVSEEFSRVFEVMMHGGSAHLEQLDGGGIEVVAQLPGKRSRASAAFSGGERSLIASSLLFGVLKMRPAPFCVLDEVDAALDEGNVDRYLAALRDISQHTQAIVVTHNRATMAAADVLYGLTMDAEGASGLLSLRLDTQVAG